MGRLVSCTAYKACQRDRTTSAAMLHPRLLSAPFLGCYSKVSELMVMSKPKPSAVRCRTSEWWFTGSTCSPEFPEGYIQQQRVSLQRLFLLLLSRAAVLHPAARLAAVFYSFVFPRCFRSGQRVPFTPSVPVRSQGTTVGVSPVALVWLFAERDVFYLFFAAVSHAFHYTSPTWQCRGHKPARADGCAVLCCAARCCLAVTSCASSVFFFLYVRIVYWCSSTYQVYLTINTSLLGITTPYILDYFV